jgi:hypothetical protein
VSVADLADGVADGLVLDEDGQVAEPLLLVDLDGRTSPAVLERAAARARGSERLLAGIATGPPPEAAYPLLAALDLSMTAAGDAREYATVSDPVAEAMEVSRAVAASPQASLVLGHVLRITGALPVLAALDGESFAYSTLLGGREFGRWLGDRGARPLPRRRGSRSLCAGTARGC